MAHIHEKIDFCVDVFIVNDNSVLLRMHEKYHTWLAPGGHIELNEDPVEAAIREAKEETGIDIKLIGEVPKIEGDHGRELLVPRRINRHTINDKHEHIGLVYFATSDTRETNPAPGEARDCLKWFSEKELTDFQYGVSPRIQVCAKEALKATRV